MEAAGAVGEEEEEVAQDHDPVRKAEEGNQLSLAHHTTPPLPTSSNKKITKNQRSTNQPLRILRQPEPTNLGKCRKLHSTNDSDAVLL